MVKSGLACCVFTMVVLVTMAVQNPPNAEKKQPGHAEIPGRGGLGDHRWNDLYSDRSISVANQRTAAIGRPLTEASEDPGAFQFGRLQTAPNHQLDDQRYAAAWML